MSALLPENARPVRPEDSFDVRKLAQWLSTETGISEQPEVFQFSGGASNLTYLLRYSDRDLVLRRPPGGKKPKSGHDMAREYRIQSLVKEVYPHVPEMIALCTDQSILGSEFYVMESIPGIVLRGDSLKGLTGEPGKVQNLCKSVFDLLIELHGIDPKVSGLSEFSRGSGYVERQITGWSKRYDVAHTPNVPDFREVMKWLEKNRPNDIASTIIHGDFRLDNVVCTRVDDQLIPVAVLDWELATVGDPLMDLGSSLAYWVQADDEDMFKLASPQPSFLAGMFTRDEIVHYWQSKTLLPIDNWIFYEVFGLFRLAAIAQQIYYRFHHGQTTNPVFENFWMMVVYLHDRVTRIISGAL
ncbi:MAG: phosphotransferase family protein [Mycobacteriaceae bacterium]